jgi:hypothetical protein
MYKAGYKAIYEPMNLKMTGADEDQLVEYLTSLK